MTVRQIQALRLTTVRVIKCLYVCMYVCMHVRQWYIAGSAPSRHPLNDGLV